MCQALVSVPGTQWGTKQTKLLSCAYSITRKTDNRQAEEVKNAVFRGCARNTGCLWAQSEGIGESLNCSEGLQMSSLTVLLSIKWRHSGGFWAEERHNQIMFSQARLDGQGWQHTTVRSGWKQQSQLEGMWAGTWQSREGSKKQQDMVLWLFGLGCIFSSGSRGFVIVACELNFCGHTLQLGLRDAFQGDFACASSRCLRHHPHQH